MKPLLATLMLAGLVCVNPVARAQSASDVEQAIQQQQLDMQQQQDALKRAKQERQRALDLQQWRHQLSTDDLATDAERCLPVSKVRFEGFKVLPDDVTSRTADLVKPYLDHCLTTSRLTQILKDINELFTHEGLVTTHAFLPAQDPTSDALTLRVLVGEEPPEAPESTIANVVPARPTWLGERISLGGDSLTSRSDYHGRLDLAADDLTGLDDDLMFNYNRSMATRFDARSQGFGFDYSFPWRYSTLSLNGNLYKYQNSVVGPDRKYQISGNSRVIDMSANHTLFANPSTRLDGQVSLISRENNSYTEGTRLDDSSRQFSVLRVEGRLHHYLGFDTTAFTRFSAERGLDVFGADSDQSSVERGTSRFRTYSVFGSVGHTFWRWALDLSGQYQYSPDVLPYSEQILVASSSLMSGFADQSLAGDQGGWVRLDANSPWFPTELIRGLHSNLRLSVLRGWVPQIDGQDDPYGAASAAELAVQIKTDDLTAGMRVGRMLDESATNTRKPDHPDIAFTLSMNL
ncbi:MAG: ShlB/FhaC/HecB family hemolysin secretion/activation protein [Marinobacter sp.]|nr:ShlB/FhaC/HecB family hemolysin secretion/activation protein [Marinobacter sp.]